jgi:hypothetical protein
MSQKTELFTTIAVGTSNPQKRKRKRYNIVLEKLHGKI